ncbi:MAG: hypothetical protein EOO90_20020 [Pedobacter sp.]|nr:MAG: hypothetical protein EOO90_20020 [Pedobacter sp.]
MNFLEIIKSPITNLPIIYKGSFREMLRDKILRFGEIIDSSSDLSDSVDGMDFNDSRFKERSRILRQGILKTLDIYYTGDPSGAFKHLSNTLRATNISGFLNKNYELPEMTNLYRIRKSDGNYPLTKEDLFHIPFQTRSRVNTQRFSIPGLPSLYVANSVYVAWEELQRPAISEMQVARLSNNYSLKLLDLTSDIFSRNSQLIDNASHGWDLLYRVTVWPLVAACSVKVIETNDPFKPEYIIPQLLLQWVNKNMVSGIKYSSSHIDLSDSEHDGHFYNIVFPVQTFEMENGYCRILQNAFKSTQILPLQLRQFITQSDRLDHQASISSAVNPDINSITLIKGAMQPYSSTIFGIAEHNLKGLELESF